MNLHIDVETYSSEDLKKVGAYRYCESVDFEILMIAFAYDDNPVQILDLAAGEEIPEHFLAALGDSTTTLCAHNATFERLCFAAHGLTTRRSKWRCTMVKAAYCGYPLPLDKASEAMGLSDKKDAEGKALIRYFSMPVKATKVNEGRTRNYSYHDVEKWEKFKEYCKQDVEVERSIDKELSVYEIPDFEKKMYVLDQEVNDRGVMIDLPFVKKCLAIDDIQSAKLFKKMQLLTDLDNPNSQPQLTGWLSQAMGKEIKSLAKDLLPPLLEEAGGAVGEKPEIVKEVIRLRMRASKTSIKKYVAMENCIGFDGRGRGFFQYYGANRTGRWAGRLVQLQNLPKIYMDAEELDATRHTFKNEPFAHIDENFDKISDRLSQLIRTAFIAKPGHTFAVADFSAIEARVIAWYANEQWRLDVFNSHGKIYEASASKMFNVPIEKVTKDSGYRAKGKVAELALGYQGAVGALKQMGGEAMGLSENEMKGIVNRWRAANPNIKQLWGLVERAAIAAVQSKKVVTHKLFRGMKFYHDGKCLRIILPSGRQLFYQDAEITISSYNRPAIRYKGMENHKWQWVDTYGGKLVENIVQATARDVLAVSMSRIKKAGYEIVLHVHDEAAAEVPLRTAEKDLEIIEDIMGMPIDWAEGMPLNAEGYLSEYYKKD